MEKVFIYQLLAIATILSTFYSCKKDNDTIAPIDEETTTTPSTSNFSDFFSLNL